MRHCLCVAALQPRTASVSTATESMGVAAILAAWHSGWTRLSPECPEICPFAAVRSTAISADCNACAGYAVHAVSTASHALPPHPLTLFRYRTRLVTFVDLLLENVPVVALPSG